MSDQRDKLSRTILPIPDIHHLGVTTYDAKDPDIRFNGKINWVKINLGKDAEDADHYITHAERLRVAMARQQKRRKQL